MGFLKEITMDVEIIDKRLVVTPTTHDDVRLIYAIAAAWTAFDAVICPVSGEPLRCNEDGTAESELPQRGQDHEKRRNDK